jgi:pimeloyl-ACP methyl ester carboxylesterase
MGTPVIVQYARLYPQHTAALVFVDGLVTIPRDGGSNAPNAAQMGGPNGKQAREQMIRGMFSDSTTPEMQKHILSMMLAPPESTAVGAMQATFDPAIWKEDTLSMPILGIYADGSRLGNRDYMKVHFPALDYHEIPGTGHFLMMEKPDDFNGLLLAFLQKQKF